MALSRRQFVQTAGLGAGAALTSSIWGRGRENAIWSAFEPDLQAVERGVICIASNENPVGPGQKVLGSLRSLLENTAKPGRYSNQAGELTEAIAAHFKVKTDNVLVSEGSTEILRAATSEPERSTARTTRGSVRSVRSRIVIFVDEPSPANWQS